MASQNTARSCNIVLHDDRISPHDALGGVDILPIGSVAYLSTKDIPDVLVISKAKASGSKDISLHVRLAARFGFVNRTHGKIVYVRDPSQVAASHIDILLRDQILSRADLWHQTRQLDQKIVYRDADLRYLGNNSASIQHVYLDGQDVSSAICQDGSTKAIVRSGNARFMILVQVSREMLADWTDGDLLYEKLVGDFLLELFQRWQEAKARHLVSIVLFGRACESVSGDEGADCTDFFVTLHLDTPCIMRKALMLSLKRAFNSPGMPRNLSFASSGNLLEAINLTTAHFLASAESIHLSGTGSAMIIVTAGSGLFEANYALLNTTTRVLLGHSIGINIVSLAEKPTHPVPLFRYMLDGKEEYAIPHWADISFFRTAGSHLPHRRQLRATIERTLDEIEIPLLTGLSTTSSLDVDTYDEDTFSAGTFADPADRAEQILAKLSTLPTDSTPTKTKAIPPKLRQHPSTSSIATTISLNRQNKINALSLLSNRKISVGPRGLAPITSMASATVSAAHASQDREPPQATMLTPRENESGIAKQIRASLRRRPSQSSITSRFTEHEDLSTQAIPIESAKIARQVARGDAFTLSVSADSKHSSSSLGKTLRSSSKTLKAFENMAASPQKLSLDPSLAALTPWLTLLNPCNPRHDNMRIVAQYRQWQHVFPKAVGSEDFKWAALCTPAALPLYHDLLPSPDDWKKYYKRATRRLICAQPDGSGQRPRELMQRLIALRLAHGFQLVSSPQYSKDTRVFMSTGADYHELHCLSELELEIVEYTYRPHTPPHHLELDRSYNIEVTSSYSEESVIATTRFARVPPEIDWGTLDQEMGSARVPSSLSRLRLVLLPDQAVELDGEHPRELADDERRIEGIQRLTQQWQRHRIFTAEDQSHQVSFTRTTHPGGEDRFDPNPLAIEYHTRDPSALVNSQENSLNKHTDNSTHQAPLFAESEMFHSSNFDIVKLVRQMQEAPPHGVEVRDRRWFARIHLKCFRGDEMTNWLLGAFKDLETRAEAVEMGNELMRRGLFNHVRHKHIFLDGNYFYQIAQAHRIIEYPNAIASMFNRGSTKSIPPTPSSEVRMSPQVRPSRGGSESSGPDSAQLLPVEKKQVTLSHMLRYSVDAAGKSAFDEVVNIHYDRIHNPENCYHIHLDWCLTTPMLIRDSISRWANLVEGYGLRLVQVPLLEASKHSASHPFQQPVHIRLSHEPPDRVPATPQPVHHGGSPRVVEDRTFYHKAVLRKLGFVLDFESADSFSDKLDVSVSWGKIDISMTQFVHRSGLVLAQISKTKQWDFLLLPNTLAADRAHGSSGRNQIPETASSVVQSVRELAKDIKALRAVYEEAVKPRTYASSPFTKAAAAHADADIPPMQLPPHLLHRVFS